MYNSDTNNYHAQVYPKLYPCVSQPFYGIKFINTKSKLFEKNISGEEY